MTIKISNEDDLFKILEDIRRGGHLDPNSVIFNGWPKYEVVIRGEDFNGGVPTRIMPALLSLQKSIDEAYAQSLYGEKRRLTKEERRRTEIVVHLHQGSTKFEASLWDILNNLLKAAAKSMNGTQTLIAILGVAAIAGSSWSLKIWLETQSHDKKIEFDAKANEQETERYRILADLANQNAQLASAKAAFEQTNRDLINRLEDKDTLVLDDSTIVTGAEGRKIVRNAPDAPIEIRLDGKYRILSVQSGAVKSGFKATVENIETGEHLMIDIPDGTLTSSQLESLQKGEWEKTPLHMQINASKRGNKILKATLTHAGLGDSQ